MYYIVQCSGSSEAGSKSSLVDNSGDNKPTEPKQVRFILFADVKKMDLKQQKLVLLWKAMLS